LFGLKKKCVTSEVLANFTSFYKLHQLWTYQLTGVIFFAGQRVPGHPVSKKTQRNQSYH
jgi:hypothetical protein